MKENSLTAPIALSNATLAALSADVARPTYNRGALTPGIVHIGLGNFHRAHQAWYLHRLMQAGEALDWAILGAGVRPYDKTMREKLLAQECLTTLIELSPDSRAAEVTGPMIDYLPIEDGNGPLIAAMSDPAIRIVAMTVTEGGYFIDGTTGGLDLDHLEIIHDVNNPDRPRTVFGAMVSALAARRAAGHPPFTGLSCDNLSGNGAILRQAIVGLAQQRDPELARWIDQKGAFPNSMVDCIVPATGPAELDLVRQVGIDDAAPVSHENFRQWVLEDNFVSGRPNWDRAGAIFTKDVHAYEMMKIRILNAGHQVLANAGELLSLETIADCMADTRVSAFFHKLQVEQILPYVDAVPGMTPTAYLALIEKRFSNSAIRDTTRRVAFDGSSRHTGFVMPILRDALAAGGSVEGLALVEALWARMCAGTREDGSVIEPNDPNWDALHAAGLAAKDRQLAWLQKTGLYGDLASAPSFADAFVRWLKQLWRDGTEATIAAYLRR